MQEQEHAGEQPHSHSSQPQSASVAQGEVEVVETVDALFVNMLSVTGEEIMRQSNNARVMMAQMINSRLRGDGKLTTEQYNMRATATTSVLSQFSHLLYYCHV